MKVLKVASNNADSPWMRPHTISQLAHAKWVGRQRGTSELHDWLEAESELRLVGQLSQELGRQKQRVARVSADCKRLRRLLAVHAAVGGVLAGSCSLAVAGPRILAAIAKCLCQNEGRLWIVDAESGEHRLSAHWEESRKAPDPESGRNRDRTLLAEIDLPSRRWASGLSLWESWGDPGTGCIRQSPTALAVAIRNDKFHGTMEFRSRDPGPIREDLLLTIAELGNQIGRFLESRETERRLLAEDADRRVARQIQERLLPRATPRVPGFAIAGRCCPADVIGGDCFDFMSLGPGGHGGLGVLIADASGHGVAAALMASETRAYLRALALQTDDVGSLVTLTNRRLSPEIPRDEYPFVTLFVARLEPATRVLTYANAGHCAAQVLAGDGHTRYTLDSTGCPLALETGAVFESSPQIRLESGDLVFMYSDGLTEAMSAAGQLFGLQRAMEYVRTHRSEGVEDILSGLFNSLREYTASRPQTDDITAVIIKVDSPQAGTDGGGAHNQTKTAATW